MGVLDIKTGNTAEFIPNWKQGNTVSDWLSYKSYIKSIGTSKGVRPFVHAYTTNVTISATTGSYNSGVLAADGRIYLAPYNTSDENAWHYIETGANKNFNESFCTNPFVNKY